MKRTLATLVLVTLLAVSEMAFALLPANDASSPAPVDGDSIAELTDFGLPYLFSEECPAPTDTGCGG